MIERNAKLGYWSITILGFRFMIVTGYCGNLYPRNTKRVLRIDFGDDAGIHRMKIQIIHKNQIKTDLYIYRFFQPWKWIFNSELIAVKLGEVIDGGELGPDYHRYKGILGYHLCV